ncbi:MAG: phytanoyl-CoA dioxygenase family protein [Planctomycetaceae bacterium]|nr:phytanoyl-CoA dioxygenase family protein [Planctomycetaceae bacterium]
MTAVPSFKILPEQDELAQMQRDLRFYPSQVTAPKVLSRELIAQFNRDGYVKGLRVLDAASTERNRQYFDALLAKVLAAGGDSYSISTAHLKYGYVYDLITNSRIVDCVADILGPNVIGWGSHFFCKMPKDGKEVAWHQDASYWPLTPSKTVTVWLAVDDADRENACMKFIAGSQNFGHLTYRPSSEADHNVLNQSIDNAEQYGTVVYDELWAGEFSIHSDLLLHGSEANLSDRRRCGLTLRYCTPDVRAGSEWNKKGVVVRGSDPTGHWANPPRPSVE